MSVNTNKTVSSVGANRWFDSNVKFMVILKQLHVIYNVVKSIIIDGDYVVIGSSEVNKDFLVKCLWPKVCVINEFGIIEKN